MNTKTPPTMYMPSCWNHDFETLLYFSHIPWLSTVDVRLNGCSSPDQAHLHGQNEESGC